MPADSPMDYNNTSADLMNANVIAIRKAVFGGGATADKGGVDGGGSGGGEGGGPTIDACDTAGPHSQGMAVQSVAQSMAILVQDTADLFRNIGTIESTAIGAATAKWLADPLNPAYEAIIQSSTKVLQDAAKLVGDVGETAAKVLAEFPNANK